ncbi:MAG: TM2 domain-containing protein [Methylovulum sp.]|uniref:TM2 domain-containing protein n=1 Tax=Methylovulum sp. TaxID=1916980 RepID=UPI00260D9849|nr:TM2 domain-containing protein [Methylovulum sp.]MDD2724975.1 TM2 domain-containing protein [Methylovulum sp.]MDD5123501.1 TM2 domain-containing protein [Methylovulum sp.]
MIGHIESYDPDNQTGVIKSDEKFFAFHIDDWVAQEQPEQGDDIKFDADGTAAKNIDLVGAYLEKPKPVKYKYVAAALAILLGSLGLHRLYLGQYLLVLRQIIITVALGYAGFLAFAVAWGFIDGFLIIAGHINKDAKGRPFK